MNDYKKIFAILLIMFIISVEVIYENMSLRAENKQLQNELNIKGEKIIFNGNNTSISNLTEPRVVYVIC